MKPRYAIGFLVSALVVVAVLLAWQRPQWLLTAIVAFSEGQIDHRLVESNLPVELAWQFQADGPIAEAAVEGDDGALYVGTNHHLYSLDPTSGNINWQSLAKRLRSGFILPHNDSVLMLTNQDSVLWALSTRDGTPEWQVNLDHVAQARSGVPSADQLLADSERVYLVMNLQRGTDAVALEPATGRILWHAPPELSATGNGPFAAFLDGERLVIVTGGDVFALDAKTGELLQWFDGSLGSFRPPAYSGGTIYTNGDVVRALDSTTLAEKWRISHGCRGLLAGDIPYPPLVVDGVVYITTSCELAYAVDANTGRLLWRYSEPNHHSLMGFTVFQGHGYLVTHAAELVALDLNSGLEVGRASTTPAAIVAPPDPQLTATRDLLLVSFGDHRLFAFHPPAPKTTSTPQHSEMEHQP